jgi:AraC-like DNA-binding protein
MPCVDGPSWNYRPYNRATSIEMGGLETTRPISPTTHFHLEFQVAAVARGWRIYSTPLGDFCASPGEIVIIPARPHASHGGSASIITHLYVPSGHPSAHGIVAPQIIRCMRAHSPSDILDAIGSMCEDGQRDNRSASKGVLPESALGQELDVSSIAAQLGYSTDGFIRAFRRQFRMPGFRSSPPASSRSTCASWTHHLSTTGLPGKFSPITAQNSSEARQRDQLRHVRRRQCHKPPKHPLLPLKPQAC